MTDTYRAAGVSADAGRSLTGGTLLAAAFAVAVAQIGVSMPAVLNDVIQLDLRTASTELTWVSDAAVLQGGLMTRGGSRMVSPLQHSVRLWWVAIGAGVFETLLVLAAVASGHGPDLTTGALVAQVVVRSVVFVVAGVMVVLLARGSRVAAWVLTLGLGVVGLASLLVGPLGWLLDGAPLDAVPTSGLDLGFALSRVVHVAAVLGATTLMWRGSSRAERAARAARATRA